MKLTKMPEPRFGGETTCFWIPTTQALDVRQKEELRQIVEAWCLLGWWRGYGGGTVVNNTSPRFDPGGIAWGFDGYYSIADKDLALDILVRCLEEFGRREHVEWDEIIMLGDA